MVKKTINKIAYLVFIISCGGNPGVPDAQDAAVEADADLCGCPTGDLLAEHVGIYRDPGIIPSNFEAGRGWDCDYIAPERDSFIISGSCIHDPFHPQIYILHGGFYIDGVGGQIGWECYWGSRAGFRVDDVISAACVDTVATTVETPPECECPPVEPFRNRIYPVTGTGTILPYQTKNRVEVSCDPGSVLLGGGCMTRNASNGFAKLTRSGFDPADPDTWVCGWKQTRDSTVDMAATVMCMIPPSAAYAADTEPIADRVIRVEANRNLPGNALVSNTIPCPPGTTILSGSCMIDSDVEASYEPLLSIVGFDELTPNAWHCGWSNPIDTSFNTIATAICLVPPAP